LHGIPHFAISIAVRDKGKIIAGTIYDPCRHEFYFAETGKGAYLNDRRIRVSGRRSMADCLFATGIPFLGRGSAETDAKFLQELNAVMQASSGVRRFGAAALDLAFLAAGRYDGFWDRGLSVWDIAAGVLIVREAGGLVSDFASRDKALESGDVVACNSAMHASLLKTLRSANAS
jgi:myo-inositol-1(or 4)-monophosphatase